MSTVLDSPRQLDSLDSAVKSTASTALDSSRQLSTVRQRSVLSSAVKLSSSTVRQSRQLDSSTAEAGASMHELVAPLDGMALFEVHPSRKMSLDKCSHQGSAHWHQSLARCALHPGVICPRGWRSLHLCTVMGCFPPIGGYTKSGAMLVVMAKKMPHHGAAILGGTPSLWSAWMERTPAPGANDPWMEGAPCKAYCCQYALP